MKKFFLPMLLIAALSFVSCKDDLELRGDSAASGEDDGRSAYISATIALPSAGGSRSATDETGDTNSNGSSDTGNENTDDKDKPGMTGPDYEIGSDDENDVRSMILVVTDANDQYLTHLVVNGLTQAPTANGNKAEYTITTRIPYQTLEKSYAEGGVCYNFSKAIPMRLYAFCNYTNNMLSKFNTFQTTVKDEKVPAEGGVNPKLQEWRDFEGMAEEKASMAGQTPQSINSIWAPRSFLMANAEVFETKFPESLELWDQYSDDRNPLDLTAGDAIDVERVAARIDFRDASPEGNQTYHIRIDRALFNEVAAVDATPADNSDDYVNLFDVRLTRMILVNMSKKFYYLRRVIGSDETGNPKAGSDVEYIGKEKRTSWVVDTDWETKALTDNGAGITPDNASDHFNFPLYDPAGQTDAQGHVQYNNVGSTYGWYISTIADVLAGKNDNWEPTTSPDGYNDATNGYHIWRYVTENTLPSIDQQKTIQSTGIIFKASIEVGKDIDALDNRFVSEATRDALLSVKDQRKAKYPVFKKYEVQSDGSYKAKEGDDATYGINIPALYSFHNMIYGGVEDIVRAAKRDNKGGALYYAVNQIINNWYLKKGEKEFKYLVGSAKPADELVDDGEREDVGKFEYVQLNVIIAEEIVTGNAPTDGSEDYSQGYTVDWGMSERNDTDELSGFNKHFIENCPSQGITVFIPTREKENDEEGWGYYCYYFYWMRHNDNGYNGKMGTMEFGTVRNNIYKLAVTNISAIGHPRDTTRDPDPVDPNDPDEQPERSIKVEVDVLPWVVRVNNIEF